MAKRAHHWKHGWIPLDAFARAVARRHDREHAEYEAKRHGDTAKADHDWVVSERAKYEAAQKAKAAPRPAAKPLVIRTGLSDAPKAPAAPRTSSSREVSIADQWTQVSKSAPLSEHVEAYYQNVAYAKATGKLDGVAEDYELDDFLTSISDVGRAPQGAARNAAAKRLLEHAKRLGIALPPALQAAARG
jgi:hypothetical protein